MEVASCHETVSLWLVEFLGFLCTGRRLISAILSLDALNFKTFLLWLGGTFGITKKKLSILEWKDFSFNTRFQGVGEFRTNRWRKGKSLTLIIDKHWFLQHFTEDQDVAKFHEQIRKQLAQLFSFLYDKTKWVLSGSTAIKFIWYNFNFKHL